MVYLIGDGIDQEDEEGEAIDGGGCGDGNDTSHRTSSDPWVYGSEYFRRLMNIAAAERSPRTWVHTVIDIYGLLLYIFIWCDFHKNQRSAASAMLDGIA